VTALLLPTAAAGTSGTAGTAGAAPADVVGNATHFDGLGAPYGGCGLPQAQLDSPDFVALNVFNTPGDYSTSYPRPLPPALATKEGAWNNGLNCGRWVEVTIGDLCTGINDGAPNQPFCRNGSWTADGYDGATLTMLVADSCADPNAWCRDDPHHLDLATDSLNRFTKNGTPVATMYPGNWNNRRIAWSFVPAPDYSGDIRIGFLKDAKAYWPAIAVSHLPNGIHALQYLAGGTWHDAPMNSDMGQSYIPAPLTAGGTRFTIRIRDAADSPLLDGRTYTFDLPASCSAGCGPDYTAVTYTTQDPGPGGPPSPTPSASAGTTASPDPTTSPTASAPSGTTGCAATWRVPNAWPGGYQVDVTVANSAATTTSGWSVNLALPSGTSISAIWNAAVDPTAPATTVRNAPYDNAIPPGGSTTWGMTLNGTSYDLGPPRCTTTQP
jgi:hypothetical protein